VSLRAGDRDINVTFISDNCCGQNKNKYLVSIYVYAVTTIPNIKSITRKYLIKGNTHRTKQITCTIRFPHCANICVHEHVCLYWVWVLLCIICMYLQKNVYKYILIRYLESITQALKVLTLDIDRRECKC
jgi:hypothetical protein